MRCTRNAPAGIEVAALALALLLAGVPDAQARRVRARRPTPSAETTSEKKPASDFTSSAPSLRMQDTAITGERQAPDVIFIVPTGKGGKARSPHLRDYGSEILEPVVKSWLEKEETVEPMAGRKAPEEKFDWKAAFREQPRPSAPPPEPLPVPAPPPPRPAAPAFIPQPSQLTTPEGIPILVPPQ